MDLATLQEDFNYARDGWEAANAVLRQQDKRIAEITKERDEAVKLLRRALSLLKKKYGDGHELDAPQ